MTNNKRSSFNGPKLPDYKELFANRYSKIRMASPGMLSRVALVRTDISEELTASFIGVTRIGEQGQR
jgi:hypothetical protein